MGSRDRKQVQQLVYRYFRLGKWKMDMPLRERILTGTYLCISEPDELLTFFKPDWDATLPLEQKCPDWNPVEAFPFAHRLSPAVDAVAFANAYLQQPKLFIRMRPGKEAAILEQVKDVPHERIGSHTLAFANSTRIETLIPDKSSYEIQDLSSQETGNRFHPKPQEQWWDCCAASGGKSIMLYDKEPSVKLLVSDVRESIIDHLKLRFAAAGIRRYTSQVVDLTRLRADEDRYDGIILDAPCTGSGTWGRTPEQLHHFKEGQILKYTALQQQIARNVTHFLKPGGTLIYITCSVFKEENEDIVRFLEKECWLTVTESTIIKGYDREADTMFVAVCHLPETL